MAGDDVSLSGSQESATLLEMKDAHAMIKNGLLRTITPDQVRTMSTVFGVVAIPGIVCTVVARAKTLHRAEESRTETAE